jgi:hypothetical protein
MPRPFICWTPPSSATPNIAPWGQSREPTSDESDALDHYVFMPSTPIRILGERNGNFNCLAWALGMTTQIVGPQDSSPSLELISNGFAGRLFRPATPDSADVAIWVNDGAVSHVSVRWDHPQLGSIWTSKLGWRLTGDSASGFLISHTLTEMAALNNHMQNYAGHVELYLQRGPQRFDYDDGADEDPMSPLEQASLNFIVEAQAPAVVPGYNPGEYPDGDVHR